MLLRAPARGSRTRSPHPRLVDYPLENVELQGDIKPRARSPRIPMRHGPWLMVHPCQAISRLFIRMLLFHPGSCVPPDARRPPATWRRDNSGPTPRKAEIAGDCALTDRALEPSGRAVQTSRRVNRRTTAIGGGGRGQLPHLHACFPSRDLEPPVTTLPLLLATSHLHTYNTQTATHVHMDEHTHRHGSRLLAPACCILRAATTTRRPLRQRRRASAP